jgi:maintenance of morphology protein 1
MVEFPNQSAEFDLMYTDTLSLSLSTSYLFNYPMTSFARLPVSLTISLSLFKSSVRTLPGILAFPPLYLALQITLTPPSPTSPTPVLTIAIPPEFTLDLKTTSLMGSRAKLADVPKLHELIQHQVRRILAARAIWKIVLPGLVSDADAKHEIREELAREGAKL